MARTAEFFDMVAYGRLINRPFSHITASDFQLSDGALVLCRKRVNYAPAATQHDRTPSD
jgi:hypothetical protein